MRSYRTFPPVGPGLTDHVWTLREGLCLRVPPWSQPQTAEGMVPGDAWGVERLRCAQMEAKRAG
jgi:hypothetical protein